MASSWGVSWGFSWGNSWGSIAPPTPPFAGSGGGRVGTGKTRRTKSQSGWQREKEIFQASLEKFRAQASQELQKVHDVLSTSEQTQAKRIARKLIEYSGELDEIQSLQRELAKLEAASDSRTRFQQDIIDAAQALSDILRDEEDTVMAMMAIQDFESRQLLGMMGINVH